MVFGTGVLLLLGVEGLWVWLSGLGALTRLWPSPPHFIPLLALAFSCSKWLKVPMNPHIWRHLLSLYRRWGHTLSTTHSRPILSSLCRSEGGSCSGLVPPPWDYSSYSTDQARNYCSNGGSTFSGSWFTFLQSCCAFVDANTYRFRCGICIEV